MTVQPDLAAFKRAFPNAKSGAIDAFIAKWPVLERAGVAETKNRLSIFLAQLDHESGGLTITAENLNYTASRMTKVWPSRFPTVESALAYAGNPKLLANKVYGGRMGNRPGTDDGYNYRGRGFIQITGRDGYRNVGERCALQLEDKPDLAGDISMQPEITTGFWKWKNLNPVADTGDFKKVTKLINGGYNGLQDREARLARIKPIVEKLKGGPASKDPPKEVINAATAGDRKQRQLGAGTVAVGGGNEVAKTQTTAQLFPSYAAYALGALGIVLVIVATIVIVKKTRAVRANWR